MAQVLIRNLDDETVARLKREAEHAGLSLEAYLRQLVSTQQTLERAELIEAIDRMRRTVRPPGPGEPLAEELIREGREQRARGQAKLHGLDE
jgi:plasmid stability protein